MNHVIRKEKSGVWEKKETNFIRNLKGDDERRGVQTMGTEASRLVVAGIEVPGSSVLPILSE